MNKRIAVSILTLCLLASPLLASAQSAQTGASLETTLIAALRQLVQVLEQELQGLMAQHGAQGTGSVTTSPTPTVAVAPSISTNTTVDASSTASINQELSAINSQMSGLNSDTSAITQALSNQ